MLKNMIRKWLGVPSEEETNAARLAMRKEVSEGIAKDVVQIMKDVFSRIDIVEDGFAYPGFSGLRNDSDIRQLFPAMNAYAPDLAQTLANTVVNGLSTINSLRDKKLNIWKFEVESALSDRVRNHVTSGDVIKQIISEINAYQVASGKKAE